MTQNQRRENLRRYLWRHMCWQPRCNWDLFAKKMRSSCTVPVVHPVFASRWPGGLDHIACMHVYGRLCYLLRVINRVYRAHLCSLRTVCSTRLAICGN